MKRLPMVFILCFMASMSLQAQDYELFYKYWTHRERFYKQYVRVDWEGDGIGDFVDWEEPSTSANFTRRGLYTKAGFSIPADGVDPWYKYATLDSIGCGMQPVNVRHPGTIPGAPNIIEVVRYGGDATYRLGNYFALLATEYKLLVNNGQTQRAQKTLEELYLALQAARRLDMTANRWIERQMTCPTTPPVINHSGYTGLMVREDAPYDFWEEYRVPTVPGNPTHSGYGAVVGHQVACGIKDGTHAGIASDVSPTQHEYDVRNGYATLSQDQIIGILFGLRFITKLIPDNTLFNGNNIKHMAGHMAMNILNTVLPNITRNMIIPLCPPFEINNHYGGHTAGFIYPMTLSCLKIAGESGAYPVPFLPSLPRDLIVWGSFYNFYMKLLQPYDLHYNFVLGMRVAITSEFAPLWEVEHMNNQSMQYADSFYPMAAAILYGQSASSIDASYQAKMSRELGLAPCNSPSYYNEDYYPHVRWRASMKWDRPWISNGTPNRNGHEKDYGAHNGMDYMLAYNLYHLLYHPNKAYYDVDAPENNIGFPFSEDYLSEYPLHLPGIGNTEIGSDLEPIRLFGNTIVSETTINGEVTTYDQKAVRGHAIHKAKESITMKAGFNAKAGSLYEAMIEDPFCKWNDNNYFRSSGSNDTRTEIENEESDFSEEHSSTLTIYPNPTQSQTTLNLQLDKPSSVQIILYNLSGQQVKELVRVKEFGEGKHNFTLQLTDLSSGMYLVKVLLKDNVLTKRIMVAK